MIIYKKILPLILMSSLASTSCQTSEQLYNQGCQCIAQKQFDNALALFQEAIATNPWNYDAAYNCAYILKQQSRMYEAIPYYLNVLEKKPDHAHAHIGLAQAYLATGNVEQGFSELGWRFNSPNVYAQEAKDYLTSGKTFKHKIVLIRAEWGIGDTIWLLRYAQLIKQQGGIVKLAPLHKAIVPLLKEHPYIDELIEPGVPLPPFHFMIPMISLPFVFGTTLATIPHDIPYLWADKQRAMQWKEKIPNNKKFNIGICWAGNNIHDPQKFMPLSYFAQLASINTIGLYSLQKKDALDQITDLDDQNALITFGPDFDAQPFMDTAALMQHLDLVITVDTSIAHLAGALGIATLVILPYAADWRWMQSIKTETGSSIEFSPWYPTMKLFRQPKPGDWEGVIASIKRELVHILATKRGRA